VAREEHNPERRPGQFAQPRSRKPPTKEQREQDYQTEKNETGAAVKRQPGAQKDDLSFPKDDESKWG
jgi:hypothetical protein